MSGFFGVTTLGPDRPIYSNLRSSMNCTQYSDAEFKEKFDMCPKNPENEDEVEATHVITILTLVYGTSPLPEELMQFYTELDLDNQKHFTWDQLEAALHKLRKHSQGLAQRATQFKSAQDMKDAKVKHTRCLYGPLELYKLPLTNAQAYGYFDHDKAIAEKEC
eukprot:gene422-692_t